MGGALRPQKTDVGTLGHGSIDGLPDDRMERTETSANDTGYRVRIDGMSLLWREGEDSVLVVGDEDEAEDEADEGSALLGNGG